MPAGRKLDRDLVLDGFTILEGRAGLQKLLAAGKPFTALTCTGDVIAVGALLEARASNIDVPKQLSVTGFHDLDLSAQMDPMA